MDIESKRMKRPSRMQIELTDEGLLRVEELRLSGHELPAMVELSADEMAQAEEWVRQRLEVPVSRTVATGAWLTDDGDLVTEFRHERDYPAHPRIPGVVPGQTTELYGLPCPRCHSTDTSCWGVSTVIDKTSFECRSCGATGGSSPYCTRRIPVHLDGPCDCDPRG